MVGPLVSCLLGMRRGRRGRQGIAATALSTRLGRESLGTSGGCVPSDNRLDGGKVVHHLVRGAVVQLCAQGPDEVSGLLWAQEHARAVTQPDDNDRVVFAIAREVPDCRCSGRMDPSDCPLLVPLEEVGDIGGAADVSVGAFDGGETVEGENSGVGEHIGPLVGCVTHY